MFSCSGCCLALDALLQLGVPEVVACFVHVGVGMASCWSRTRSSDGDLFFASLDALGALYNGDALGWSAGLFWQSLGGCLLRLLLTSLDPILGGS